MSRRWACLDNAEASGNLNPPLSSLSRVRAAGPMPLTQPSSSPRGKQTKEKKQGKKEKQERKRKADGISFRNEVQMVYSKSIQALFEGQEDSECEGMFVDERVNCSFTLSIAAWAFVKR
eukprot:g46237.t1